MGPTSSQAFQAQKGAELLFSLAGLTLSPTNPLADPIKIREGSEPGF